MQSAESARTKAAGISQRNKSAVRRCAASRFLHFSAIACAAGIALAASAARAEVKLPNIFGDHMVLQEPGGPKLEFTRIKETQR